MADPNQINPGGASRLAPPGSGVPIQAGPDVVQTSIEREAAALKARKDGLLGLQEDYKTAAQAVIDLIVTTPAHDEAALNPDGTPRLDANGTPVTEHVDAVTGIAPGRTEEYKAAAAKRDLLLKQFYDEEASIASQASNLNKIVVDRQQGLDSNSLEYKKLEEARAQAATMASYYGAQVDNWNADRAQKQAQAEYDAAYQAAFTAPDKAAADKATLEAKNRLDAANAALTSAQATAQDQINAVGPDIASADLALKQSQAASAGSQAAVDAATAANAPAQKAGEAASAVGAGQVATAQGAHAEESVRAEIHAAAARGDLDSASALEILSLLDGKKAFAQAQTEGQQATTAATLLATHQTQQGDVATKIEQYGQAIKAGDMSPADADQAMEDYLSGSTKFQRQTQREAQLSGAMNSALQYGMVVPRGQRYVPGTEPGGAYAQAFASLGAPMPSVPLTDQQSVQQYVAGQGIQTQEPAAPQRFDATGAYVGGPATAPAPGMVSAPGHVPIPESTVAQILGSQPVAQQPQPAAQPAATGGTYGVPLILPQYGGLGGSAQGGWSGVYPPGTMPPLTPVGTVPYPLVGLDPLQRQAQGGTTTIPAALHGWMGDMPHVRKPDLFARQRPSRPAMFGKL